MSSFKPTALGSFAGAFLSLTAAIVGCSASGEGDPYGPTTEKSATESSPTSVKLPPKSEGAGADQETASTPPAAPTKPSKPDAGPTAASTADAGASPAAGATCGVVDQKFTQTCGQCGAQEAICESTPDGTSGTVSAYGPCLGEHGDCSAGTSEPCGKCGTRTCSNACGWGSCQNQGVCKPGQIQHETAGCPIPNTFRAQACNDTCGWVPGFTACEEPSVTLPAPGVTSSTIWELKVGRNGKRPTSCKSTAQLTPVTVFPVKLVNPNATDAFVEIWHSSAGAPVDTTVFTYLRDQPPAADSEWKMCHTEMVDGCAALQNICAVDGSGDWAGVNNVKVPANSTLIIMNTGYRDGDAGKFVLNVKTK